jgi:hypothetical protein
MPFIWGKATGKPFLPQLTTDRTFKVMKKKTHLLCLMLIIAAKTQDIQAQEDFENISFGKCK